MINRGMNSISILHNVGMDGYFKWKVRACMKMNTSYSNKSNESQNLKERYVRKGNWLLARIEPGITYTLLWSSSCPSQPTRP